MKLAALSGARGDAACHTDRGRGHDRYGRHRQRQDDRLLSTGHAPHRRGNRPRPWVKALAIYPRIELLKDQFAEAFRMARSIDAPLAPTAARLRIGALFRATPRCASRQELIDKNWLAARPGLRVPLDALLRVAMANCSGARPILRRDANGCTAPAMAAPGVGSEDHIVLTRTRLATSAARHPVHHDRDPQPAAVGPLDARSVRRRDPGARSRCSRCSTRSIPMRGQPARRRH